MKYGSMRVWEYGSMEVWECGFNADSLKRKPKPKA
jgi:hypothetical protein